MRYKEITCEECGEVQYLPSAKHTYYTKCKECGRPVEVRTKNKGKTYEFNRDPQESADSLAQFKEVTKDV